ncbi:hypothetical protein FM076_29910 [Streptomyces albus subsp. chlorinus]|uniref:DUF6397 family protein n=1 Tax=Streptomyces albus TaxID=1888 RepID=UPI00156F3003|nr:DUF6397 family protein [Streptomyces albus]NSC25152.1 hypothetical protein [Streptomyces albus subsp. chlorinus]
MREKSAGRRSAAPVPHGDGVAPRTAAMELGLRLREFELAVQIDEVRTVPGASGGARRVPREELERIRNAPDFPGGLRERLRVMGAQEASELLDINPSRFARLARAGCFSPVGFYLNRYRTLVWLYLADELRDFAENHAPLLTGRLPQGMRTALEAGADHRARNWRTRRVRQLIRHAAGPWERVAARASVLDDEILAETVPDPGERARLRALRPRLLETRTESRSSRALLEELCLAEGEEEIRWHRLMLDAELEAARASELPGTSGITGYPAALTPADPHLLSHREHLPSHGERAVLLGGPGEQAESADEEIFHPRPGREHRPDPASARPVTRKPGAAASRRRWYLLGRRKPKPAARPAQ